MNNALIEFVPSVYRFALRLTRDRHMAEDIVQETFLRAVRQLGRLRDERAMRTWLFRITVNAFHDETRKTARRPTWHPMPDEGPSDAVDRSDSHTAKLAAREDANWIVMEMDALPERQRQVFYLSAFEDLSHSQIAKVIGIEASAVKATLSIARKKLRDSLATREKAMERRQ